MKKLDLDLCELCICISSKLLCGNELQELVGMKEL